MGNTDHRGEMDNFFFEEQLLNATENHVRGRGDHFAPFDPHAFIYRSVYTSVRDIYAYTITLQLTRRDSRQPLAAVPLRPPAIHPRYHQPPPALIPIGRANSREDRRVRGTVVSCLRIRCNQMRNLTGKYRAYSPLARSRPGPPLDASALPSNPSCCVV